MCDAQSHRAKNESAAASAAGCVNNRRAHLYSGTRRVPPLGGLGGAEAGNGGGGDGEGEEGDRELSCLSLLSLSHLIDHDVRHARQSVVGRQAAEEDAGGAESQPGGRPDPRLQSDLVPHRAPDPLAPSRLSEKGGARGRDGRDQSTKASLSHKGLSPSRSHEKRRSRGTRYSNSQHLMMANRAVGCSRREVNSETDQRTTLLYHAYLG